MRICAAARRAPTRSCSRELARRAAGPTSCAALEAGAPDVIATANIGCLMHLAGTATRPVRHWVEIFECAPARAAAIMSDAAPDPTRRLPSFSRDPDALDRQRHLRPRQQRRLLLVLRHGGERAPDSCRRPRHPRRPGDRPGRRDVLPVPSAAVFPGVVDAGLRVAQARQRHRSATRSACSPQGDDDAGGDRAFRSRLGRPRQPAPDAGARPIRAHALEPLLASA